MQALWFQFREGISAKKEKTEKCERHSLVEPHRKPKGKKPKAGSTQMLRPLAALRLPAARNQGWRLLSVCVYMCMDMWVHVCTEKTSVCPCMCVYMWRKLLVGWTCRVEDIGAPQTLAIVSKSLCCSVVITVWSVFVVRVSAACFMAQPDKDRTQCVSWPSSKSTIRLPQAQQQCNNESLEQPFSIRQTIMFSLHTAVQG